ncbi:MAG: hypothetical protein HND52_14980 [Ignavibacteriae bacterium]|nr:hypothetical protein [Ignavibacteriota bacterium]NOG99258.1 hypothetical protein [Ignavibacteriota bacterium]
MKTLSYIIFVQLFLLASRLFCQQETLQFAIDRSASGSRIILNSGKTIWGKAELKNPFLAKDYILFNDSLKYDTRDVLAFENDQGYYARVENTNDFVKRIKKGKIDLYVESVYHFTPGSFQTYSHPGGSSTMYTPGGFSSTRYEYFSKDGSPVRDASYSNLSEALKDNEESLSYLRSHRTLSYFKWGSVIAGAAIIAVQLAKIDKETPPSFGGIILGAAVINLSWIFHFNQSGKIEKAIEVYNRE